MSRTITFILAIAAAVPAAGCLQKDTRHVLYLAPDGSLTWTTTESDVHSDQKDPAERRAEEQDYLSGAQAGVHRIAQGLTALGPSGAVRTQIVRRERPFTVVIEAPFEHVEGALQRLFSENALQAVVNVRREADLTLLHMRLDFGSYVELESPAAALLEDLEHLSLVLTDGRFVDADGFEVAATGRSATISPGWLERAEAAFNANGTIDLWTTWQSGYAEPSSPVGPR